MIDMNVGVALSEVPVNQYPLIDDTDFKSIEGAVAYNAGGMALRWHFLTPDGAYTVTSVTPTTSGNYDWTDQGDSGIYTIEIPASGGASINNNQVGYGWFTGVATGILPWSSPIYRFGAAIAVQTTIATLASQVSFTLTSGSADNDAYNGWLAVVRDGVTAVQVALGVVDDYTGSTKTVALSADPAVFTMAVGDYITLIPNPRSLTSAQQTSVQTAAAAALTAYDPPTKAELDVLGTAALATASALDTVDNFLDTEIAAIKAKTDSLTFTQSGHVDANVQRINDVAITGDGSGTPFDVA